MKKPITSEQIQQLPGTEFQKIVWTAIAGIPKGSVKTYSEIAIEIGRPHAVRAVGTASGKNPLLIIIPCHRVVPTNGMIGYYSGPGGVEEKRKLLQSEGVFFQ